MALRLAGQDPDSEPEPEPSLRSGGSPAAWPGPGSAWSGRRAARTAPKRPEPRLDRARLRLLVRHKRNVGLRLPRPNRDPDRRKISPSGQ